MIVLNRFLLSFAIVASSSVMASSQTPARPAGIQWFTDLEAGQAEAKRTGRPILFVSAAPHCGGISGMW